LSGLQDWIRWIGEEGGRKAVPCLAETGGLEVEVGEGGAEIYKPGFLKLQAKKGEQVGELKERGNVLSYVGGGGLRREVAVGRAMPARELGRMLAEREGETDEGREGRESFENGVSVEGEFAFTKAVAAYCKEAVREGSFRGRYVLNIKEQMEQRAMRAEREGWRVNVLMVGGSQVGRIGGEMAKKGGVAVEKVDFVQVKGLLDRKEVDRVLKEASTMRVKPDKIVVGGPGNSLFRHGEKENRGFCPERTVRVEKDREGEVKGLKVGFHMTEPTKLTMGERRQLVDRTVELVVGLQKEFPFAEVWYLTMFPRHVVRCCEKDSHMSEDDCWAMNGFRKGVDADVVEELEEKAVGIRTIEWWETMGWVEEGPLMEVRKRGIVGEDGVHLTVKANSFAAVNLCHRLAEMPLLEERWEGGSGGSVGSLSKRMRRQ